MGNPSRVGMTGPFTPHAAGFRRELERVGYRPNAVSDQLRLMAHASRWLDALGLGADELTPARVEEFLVHRRAEGYTLWLSAKAMVPMLTYLRGLGVVTTPSPAAPATEAEQLHEHYRAYLIQERGLAVGTVAGYLHVARLFCAARGVDGALHLDQLSAVEVTEFVLAECASRSPSVSSASAGPARTPLPPTGTPSGCCWASCNAAPARRPPGSASKTLTPS
jgi:integrase/recombinase XerD